MKLSKEQELKLTIAILDEHHYNTTKMIAELHEELEKIRKDATNNGK